MGVRIVSFPSVSLNIAKILLLAPAVRQHVDLDYELCPLKQSYSLLSP